jgi:hypothetical protein
VLNGVQPNKGTCMDRYDPIARIQQEIQPAVAASTVAVCLSTLTATTTDDLDRVIDQIEALMLQRPAPADALMLLYNLLLDSCRERWALLQAATEWARARDQHARAIAIEPDAWVISLKLQERDKKIVIRKGWDIINDDFEAVITELPDRVWDAADGGDAG